MPDEQIGDGAELHSRVRDTDSVDLTFVVRRVDNQASVAPASEVRNCAGAIADVRAENQAAARRQSWGYVAK